MRTGTLNQSNRILLALLAALAAVLAFSGTLGHDLVWDDPHINRFIGDQVARKGPIALLTTEYRAEEVPVGYYRPVTLTVTYLGILLGGAPFIFHALSVLLHALVTVLLFLLLDRMVPSRPAAFLGALLFALHPVHVEPVAMVSNRSDLLAGIFLLLSLLAWLRLVGAEGRPPVLAAAGAGAYFLAVLSKETAYLLPAALLVWDLVLFGPRVTPFWWGWWKRNRLPLAAWSAAAAAALALRWGVAGTGWGHLGGGPGEGHAAVALSDPALFPAMALSYLRLLAIPWPLTAYYAPAQVSVTAVTLAGAALAAAVFIAAAGRRARRAGLLGLAWAAVFLLPVSGIVPIGGALIAERYLYVPSLGFCLAVSALLGLFLQAGGARRISAAALAAILLVLAAWGTASRAVVWQDDVSLFTDLGRTTPGLPLASYNLGNAWRERGYPRDAESWYRRTLALDPGHKEAWVNLGIALGAQGRLEEAVEAYRRALALAPGDATALLDLGMTLSRLGRYGEAAEAFGEGTGRDPARASLWGGLGYSELQRGRAIPAAAALTRALALDPSSIEDRVNLGNAYLQAGEYGKAEREMVEALRLSPRDVTVRYNLFVLYRRWGRPEGETRELAAIAELDPAMADSLRRFRERAGLKP